MAGYQRLNVLLTEELDQLFEEGRLNEKETYLKRINDASDDREALMQIYAELCEKEVSPSFAYDEPEEYGDIAGIAPRLPALEGDGTDFFRGAWLGRCIGCALGQPVELWRRSAIAEWYSNAGRNAVDGYVPTHSGDKTNNGAATSDNIKCMPEDDDIRFGVLALKLLKAKGFDFDTYDVGANWMYSLPYRMVCTAENQAYLNFASVDEFGPWGKPENAAEILKKNRVNTYLNPYREWIGAQIRIDGYAYAAAGDVATASRLAYTDAALSHTKNGVYGAMFFASMIAAAFVEKNLDKCVEAAFTQIPKGSRFYAEMQKAISIAGECDSTEALAKRLEEELTPYSFVHAINNSAVCLASILFSRGDFAKAVTAAVACGMDTDCNGATVGSFMGALVGGKNIPDCLKNPLNDTFYSGIAGYGPASISGFADEYRDLHKTLTKNG